MAELRADCGSWFALCCVGLSFAASADFPVDKPAGDPCINLTRAHRCGIHASLREHGYAGCVSYDCIGAGQRVSKVTFGGRDWRSHPQLASAMFAALPVVRALHELLDYLADAGSRDAAAELAPILQDLAAEVDACAAAGPADLLRTDVDAVRGRVAPVLRAASTLVRARWGGSDRARADLAGASLAGSDLRGADLRGALLIAADLRNAQLQEADVIGADMRAADLRGARLTGALYLTQAQLNSAHGDARTVIPESRMRPAHWRS